MTIPSDATSKATTIDELLDPITSERYAKDRVRALEAGPLLADAQVVFKKTTVSTTTPYTAQEASIFSSQKTASWSKFDPPEGYFDEAGSLFSSFEISSHLGDSMAITSLCDRVKEELQVPQDLQNGLKTIESVSSLLNQINCKRNQFNRG